ncbi:flagellar motor switch protein FliG [Ilumatobacter sp.]|uniref:flagellar motor switch protein FliG n=1 Tax=Ilumatobacter sp. TaxID=1967498 RepID=UPI003B5298C5
MSATTLDAAPGEGGPTTLPALATTHLTGAQKAAIVLLKLGKERSAEIMKLLGDREVSEISSEIARAGAIRPADAQASIIEFAQLAGAGVQVSSGGINAAKNLLEAALGPERASAIMQELHLSTTRIPFDFIAKTEPRQVVNVLAGEHPQTVAIVLAHINPDQASAILGGLDEKMQRDVSVRVAKLEQTSPEVIAQLDAILHSRFGPGLTRRSRHDRADGVQTLIDILNRSDRATERSIFEGLEESEAELAENVRRRMFVFEDIIELDDRAIQLILRNVESSALSTALKGVRPEVKEKVARNMSERAAKNLDEEIQMLGQVRLATVEEAQGGIVQQIRALEESGEIIVSRGAEEFVQ